jgi:hypothetical protein
MTQNQLTRICAETSCEEACLMAISVAGDGVRQTALNAPAGRMALAFEDRLSCRDEEIGEMGANAEDPAMATAMSVAAR